MEIQQTPAYAAYIQQLGWHVATVDHVTIFYKRIPLVGVLVKIQRPTHLPYLPLLIPFLNSIHATRIAIEPDASLSQELCDVWTRSFLKFYPINLTPFLPTKTICVDLTPSIEDIFHRYESAKQRAVRRAEKHTIAITISHDVTDIIAIKSRSAGMFGSITTHGVTELCRSLGQSHFDILLAMHGSTVVGGVLSLYIDTQAYYWIAGATHKGKQLFAPTLLVHHALLRAKAHGCTSYDFIGVYDERLPKQNTAWRGFTKFKEGFGGKELYYPLMAR